jgi:1,2-diacylglycerol-3-alpha-glucose alpha-1,2-galactosyltransferase
MHTEKTGESRPLVVNLISETVGGSQGHGVHTAFLQTQRALQQAGVEVRVNCGPGSDIVHIETMGLVSLWMFMRTRERAVITAHVVPESMVGSFLWAPLWKYFAELYMHVVYSLADEVLAVSPEVVDGLTTIGLRAPIRLVPNAIDTSRFKAQPEWRGGLREKLGIAPDAFVVVCAGQVQPRKGVRQFVHMARSMPDVTFVWAGGMPFKLLTAHYSEMRRIVATAPSNCLFVGDLPYEEMPRYYAAADCLFFPSLQETFGLAIIEAAAAGLPLVLRDLPNYRALFGDSYLAGNDATFGELVRRMRDDADLRGEYAGRALTMSADFDTIRHGQLLLEAYEGVLARAEADRGRTARAIRPDRQYAFSGRSDRH